MNNLLKVSILIPVYNREKLILETLKSAVNQTYQNTEIIVVDNKSKDNTFQIVNEFAKYHQNLKVYQNEKNIGPVKNWRKCLDYSTGEYVKILFSDDLIAPNFIEKTLPYLKNNDDVGFVFTGTEIFNNNLEKRERAYFIGDTGIYNSNKFIESSLLGRSLLSCSFPVSPGNALFRKKDIEKNLIIDIPNNLNLDFNKLGAGNDLLIFLLTAKDYPKFAFVNESLAFFRSHENSITIGMSNEASLYYLIAMVYFVNNFVKDQKLKKKFNTRLLLTKWKDKIRQKITGKSLYPLSFFNKKIGIDFSFLCESIGKILIKLPLRIIKNL